MAALQAHHKLVARSQQIIRHNLHLADPFFGRWPQLFTWRPPLAGSVALVGLHVPSATAYCHALAKEAGAAAAQQLPRLWGISMYAWALAAAISPEGLAVFEQHLYSQRA
ncbi:MAG: hypothetical protein M5U34_46610 [Chloroflexi bacterium]|nr:hypothetical protein [Chloroflexota bacterium]